MKVYIVGIGFLSLITSLQVVSKSHVNEMTRATSHIIPYDWKKHPEAMAQQIDSSDSDSDSVSNSSSDSDDDQEDNSSAITEADESALAEVGALAQKHCEDEELTPGEQKCLEEKEERNRIFEEECQRKCDEFQATDPTN